MISFFPPQIKETVMNQEKLAKIEAGVRIGGKVIDKYMQFYIMKCLHFWMHPALVLPSAKSETRRLYAIQDCNRCWKMSWKEIIWHSVYEGCPGCDRWTPSVYDMVTAWGLDVSAAEIFLRIVLMTRSNVICALWFILTGFFFGVQWVRERTKNKLTKNSFPNTPVY